MGIPLHYRASPIRSRGARSASDVATMVAMCGLITTGGRTIGVSGFGRLERRTRD